MSAFWGKEYQIRTASNAQRVLDDEAADSVWKTIPIKAMINDAKIVDVMKYELFTGLGMRVKRAFNRASDPERFARGLLNHTLLSEAAGSDETKAYLETLHNEQVSVDYHYLSALNPMHLAWKHLIEQEGYDAKTNTVASRSASVGAGVYLEHILVNTLLPEHAVVPEFRQLPEWDLPARLRLLPWENPYSNTIDWSFSTEGISYLRFFFAYLDANPQPGTATFDAWQLSGVPPSANPPDRLSDAYKTVGYNFKAAYGMLGVPIDDFIVRTSVTIVVENFGYAPDEDHFHTKYYLASEGFQKPRYFLHNATAGTLPEIEATAALSTNVGEFFPLVFFRENFQSVATDDLTDTLAYQESEKLCKLLGIDYGAYAKQVYESPNIDSISQAFLMFGVPLNSKNPICLRYLYEFFHWLNLDNKDKAGVQVTADNNWLHDTKDPRKAIVFRDLSAEVHFHYIGTTSNLYSGVLTDSDNNPLKIGECTSDKLFQKQKHFVWVRESNGSFLGISFGSNLVLRETFRDIPVWRYRKQIAPNTYREVLVAEPLIAYRLTDRFGNNAQNATETEDEQILAPMNFVMVQKLFTPLDQQRLYAQSMHVIINAYEKERLSWYQTSNFQTFFKVAAVFLVVASLGSASAGVSATYAAAYAASGSVVTAIIVTLYSGLIGLVKQIGLAAIFSYTAKELGGENATIGALLLLAASLTAYGTGMPAGENLALAAGGLQGGAEQQIQIEINELRESLEQLETDYENFLEDLERRREGAGLIDDLENRMQLLNRNLTQLTPDQLYNRYEAVTAVYDIQMNVAAMTIEGSLQLPDIHNYTR